MQIEVSGIPVEIVRKSIKNLHLAVLPPDGAVRVSAPLSLSDDSIRLFVRTRLGWIRKQKEKFAHQPRQTERQFVSGETLYVWGKQYFLQVEYSYKGNRLELSGEKAMLTVRKESTAKQREAFVNEWYRDKLKTEIERLLPVWENQTGLHCTSWQTKYMTTMWGTCNAKTGKMWFNLQMAKKPLECLEYVILHELTHLKYNNHGMEFVAFMDAHMPYWREIRKLLNDSTLDYMAEEI
jgi:predicted metal-dependent hydrolase